MPSSAQDTRRLRKRKLPTRSDLENKLKNCCGLEERTEEEDILLTFAIGGPLHTMRLLKYERNCDDEVLVGKLAEILEKIKPIDIGLIDN